MAHPVTLLDGARRAAFDAWIAGMTIAEDREDGPGFAAWVAEHAAVAGDVTWAFIDADGLMCATASLVRVDRGLAAPTDGWVLAGVNVARAWRGRGVGAAVVAWVLDELRCRAAAAQRPLAVLLQADNPAAIRLYCRHGFAADDRRPGVYRLLVAPPVHAGRDGATPEAPRTTLA
jgi:GNAT superfamily N-acetyltransferase